MQRRRPSLEDSVLSIEYAVFLQVCEAVDTPRSLACYMMIHYGEIDQYLSLPMAAQDDDFPDNHLVTQALRKNPNHKLNNDRRNAAVVKWLAAEKRCAETNELLRYYTSGRITPRNSEISAVIVKAQDWIRRVLGPITRHQLDYIESNFRFGPGVTSAVKGRYTTESKKYVADNHVTERLAPLLGFWMTEGKPPVILNHATVTFVLKDASIDRAIAIEPHWNSFVQLGIGALMRRKLQRTGIDLDTLADVNRRHASRAQLEGYATIDLASASDTISRETVWLLLPEDWATLLDTARTDYAALDGEIIELEKFSSMGNGFTFELESLIFSALLYATGNGEFAAFGDDLIAHSEKVPLLLETLDFLGFECNSKKTFLAGRFFESCGHDYFDGNMVRPFYLKGPAHDFPLSMVRIGNKIRRYAHLRGGTRSCDIRFRVPYDFVFEQDHRARRTYISYGYGDNAFIRNFDECSPSIALHGHEGYIARVIRETPVKLDVSMELGAYYSVLHRGAKHSVKSTASLRAIDRTTAARQVVPEWYNLGPWKGLKDPR